MINTPAGAKNVESKLITPTKPKNPNAMEIDIERFKIIHKDEILVNVQYSGEVVSQSGIIIQKTASVVEDRPTFGIVVDASEEVKKKGEINIGDKVHFDRLAGVDFYDNKTGEHYVLMQTFRVFGIEK